MTLEQSKLDLIQWLATLQDKNVIERINDLRNDVSQDLYDDLSEEEIASIEAGIKDFENGNTVPHEEFWKKYEKHL